jgi:hypothetical protein
MNLMLNAIEAMEDSGRELTVKSELQDGQLQFSVSDRGVGLPMEKMDQIFSAFFTTKPQGSGLGLAISRSIVESHGGQLWASVNSGSGQPFISPYRFRSRSPRPWLPETLLRIQASSLLTRSCKFLWASCTFGLSQAAKDGYKFGYRHQFGLITENYAKSLKDRHL